VTRDQIAEALALKFSSEYGARNPNWDIEKPDGPDNQYHLERPMSERVKGQPYIVFTASDGYRSMRVATFYEIADAILEAFDI
jgi:hypothetical protein